jgi:SAM-dependent MidA family methyltransferase
VSWVPWREAWQNALYGPDGFFVAARPVQHFRTAVTASGLFAEAVLRVVRDEGFDTVVDVGSGSGELLRALHALDPGLLLAHEWLDNIPCDVVELDDAGEARLVLVDADTGNERLGEPVESEWLDAWWPLAEPGARAEVGERRDDAWAEAVESVTGLAIAIDYGHLADDRPPYGSLASYREGHEVDVRPDGTRDVTAHVAVDAVAERVGGCLERQRDALARLGVDGTRPALELAHEDPPRYLAELARASEAAELRARGGWGDFWWVVTDTRPKES